MKKNVAIYIPQLAGGGAERVASILSMHLPEEKYNKYIIVNDTKIQDYPHEGILLDLNTPAYSSPFGKITNIIKRIYKLRKIKKKYNIDTTISFLSAPNIINIFARKNDKIIISVRNFISKSSKGFYGSIFKFSVKYLYNRADSIVVVSHALKEDLINNFELEHDKISVIYNPYDINSIETLASEKIDDKYSSLFEKPTIITAGRLSDQKGHWHLIRAFKKVKDTTPDANLIILGKGELDNYLKDLSLKMGLEKDVYFFGFQSNPFKYISKSTVYVLPSLYEGFPNAMCEAMACGVPVVSTDCKTGPREILAPNTTIKKESKDVELVEYGILTPVCDGTLYKYHDSITKEEEMLADGITAILKNQDLKSNYSIKSLERVRDFNIKNINNSWGNEI